jgi:WD40 repeat protein
MSELERDAKLLDQFLDSLAEDANAPTPAGLEPEIAVTAQNLVQLENNLAFLPNKSKNWQAVLVKSQKPTELKEFRDQLTVKKWRKLTLAGIGLVALLAVFILVFSVTLFLLRDINLQVGVVPTITPGAVQTINRPTLLTTQSYSAAWSPAANLIATGHENKTIRLWQVDGSIKFLTAFSSPIVRADLTKVYNLRWSPDGKMLASTSYDGALQVWRVSNNNATLLKEFPNYTNTVFGWSPDSQTLGYGALPAISNKKPDYDVNLWNIKDTLINLPGHEFWPQAIAWTPDSKIVATTDFYDVVRIWDSAGKLRFTGTKGTSTQSKGLAWSPDGAVLAASGYDRPNLPNGTSFEAEHFVRLYNVDGKQIGELKNSNNLVEWSPDGKFLATYGSDNKAQIWTKDGTLVTTFDKHTGRVSYLAWAKDNSFLVSASSNNQGDNMLNVWNVDGKLLNSTIFHGGLEIRSMNLSPDNQFAVVNSSDGQTRLWSLQGQPVPSLNSQTVPTFAPTATPFPTCAPGERVRPLPSGTLSPNQTYCVPPPAPTALPNTATPQKS